MRHPEEFFGAQDLELLHIAKRLKEAQRIEELLDEAGIDYLVEVDTYFGGVIFQSARAGAFFYILPPDKAQAVSVLAGAGVRVLGPDPSDSQAAT